MTASSMRKALVSPTCKLSRWEQAKKIEMPKFFIDKCFNAQAGPCLCSVWKILLGSPHHRLGRGQPACVQAPLRHLHQVILSSLWTLNVSKSIIHDCFSAAKNYFIKYGELGVMNCAAERVTIKLVEKQKDLKKSCFQALMKQKHRLMWERRHGEVGSGMKTEAATAAE